MRKCNGKELNGDKFIALLREMKTTGMENIVYYQNVLRFPPPIKLTT
jgi:hypothetical protein